MQVVEQYVNATKKVEKRLEGHVRSQEWEVGWGHNGNYFRF